MLVFFLILPSGIGRQASLVQSIEIHGAYPSTISQYPLIEQLENTHSIIKDRFNQIGYNYFELKEYNKTFINQIQEANNTDTLLQIWEQMKVKSFLLSRNSVFIHFYFTQLINDTTQFNSSYCLF